MTIKRRIDLDPTTGDVVTNFDAALAHSSSHWQSIVIEFQTTPPGAPSVGDRYIVAATATGAWVGQEDNIAKWDGSAWIFITAIEGMAVYNLDDSLYFFFAGFAWVPLGGAINHSDLMGSGTNTHSQIDAYLAGHFSATSEGESTRTLITYAQKVRLTFTPPVQGTYVITAYAEVRNDDAGASVDTRLQLDDTTILAEHDWIPEAAMGNGWGPLCVKHEIEVLTAAEHDFDLDFKSGESGKQVRIRRARIFADFIEESSP